MGLSGSKGGVIGRSDDQPLLLPDDGTAPIGERPGYSHLAEYGIVDTRAFIMQLAVIGQRLVCKRTSCQLTLGLGFRV